jgi:WD40 repeat protein
LDGVIRRLMARSPAERFQTPAELIATLNSVLQSPDAVLQPRPSSQMSPTGEQYQSPAKLRELLEMLAAPNDPSGEQEVQAHPGGVQSLSLSLDGRLLLSGGLDQTLRLWETQPMRQTRCLAEDVGAVEQVCLTPKAKWAASCSLGPSGEAGVVQLWDLASGREVRRFRGRSDKMRCVAVSPDGRRVAVGDDRTIFICSVDKPGSPSLSLNGHTDQVSSVTFLPGETLLSGSQDGTLRLWDIKTGELKQSRNSHIGPVAAAAFGGTSRRLAMAGNAVRIRQADGSSTLLNGHEGPVLCLAFSADGQLLLTGGSDETVRLWRAADGEELCCLQGHTDKVRVVVFSPDSKFGYSGSADGTIHRWPLPG